MDKLREASNGVINKIQDFVVESIREKQVLVEEADRLAEIDEDLRVREAAVSSIEVSENVAKEQETRKIALQEFQTENARDFEANERESKSLAIDKEKWEKQKEADEKGIANERQEIRAQNAALAKEKEEYKDKILKKLKVGI